MSARPGEAPEPPHRISIVIPVYQGEKTLAPLLEEIAPLVEVQFSPDGHRYRVEEVLAVFDNGPDNSAEVMRALAREYDFVVPVWLSRNYGQHAATLAGMASSGGEWIVTLDEDGQHDPADIAVMLDIAMREQSALVYAQPVNDAPHGFVRNLTSKGSKWVVSKLVGSASAQDYNSYRLLLGSIGRGVAAYSGSGVYLDVAIGWVVDHYALAPVTLRADNARPSGYSGAKLFAHFRRMVLTSGTRGLRFVSTLGVGFVVLSLVLATIILIARLSGSIETQGWASMIVVVLFSSGAILFSLGIIAEYIGINVNMAMGKPPYLVTPDLIDGPLGRPRSGP